MINPGIRRHRRFEAFTTDAKIVRLHDLSTRGAFSDDCCQAFQFLDGDCDAANNSLIN